MMSAPLLLRIASVITLLYCAGHTAGMPWTPATGPGEATLLETMRSHRFPVEGVSRTYWDFYFGFGVAIIGYLLAQGVILWQLGSLAKSDPARVRPMVAVILAAFVFNAWVTWTYFFPAPIVFAIGATLCLALALFASRRTSVT